MRPPDDDWDEMSGDDWYEGDGGAARPGVPATADQAAVTQFLTDLRVLGEAPVPPPTPELEALLGGETTIAEARRAGRRRSLPRRGALAAAALVAATAATSAAAANHTLPPPAQRVVSNFVNTVTPFHIDPAVTPRRTHPAPASHPPPPGSSRARTDEGDVVGPTDEGTGSGENGD